MSEEDLQSRNGSDLEASTDGELAGALETYLSAVERGQAVDVDRIAAGHPAIADELRSCVECPVNLRGWKWSTAFGGSATWIA